MVFFRNLALVIAYFAAFAPRSDAQLPDTLAYSIPPPPTGAQDGARLGASLAVDAAYVVVGAPLDDAGDSDAGLVELFDSANGALRFVLRSPSPLPSEAFGNSVAMYLPKSNSALGWFPDLTIGGRIELTALPAQ